MKRVKTLLEVRGWEDMYHRLKPIPENAIDSVAGSSLEKGNVCFFNTSALRSLILFAICEFIPYLSLPFLFLWPSQEKLMLVPLNDDGETIFQNLVSGSKNDNAEPDTEIASILPHVKLLSERFEMPLKKNANGHMRLGKKRAGQPGLGSGKCANLVPPSEHPLLAQAIIQVLLEV